MTKDKIEYLYNQYLTIISIRQTIENMAEDVALIDETIANSIFTCIAAEISNRETELYIYFQSLLDDTKLKITQSIFPNEKASDEQLKGMINNNSIGNPP
ncbi:hypothetical protein RHO13_07300 [Orbus wheelerorum]|uniref:hypothetical protein n=1 Tax=Orbus wheelerorum TaxID=3074111 RepID=UPI00370DA695